jgi:hypothetical protein
MQNADSIDQRDTLYLAETLRELYALYKDGHSSSLNNDLLPCMKTIIETIRLRASLVSVATEDAKP